MKTLLELEPNDCRYPSGEGDGGGISFCPAQKYLYLFKGHMKQSSYCRERHFKCTTVSSDVRAVA